MMREAMGGKAPWDAGQGWEGACSWDLWDKGSSAGLRLFDKGKGGSFWAMKGFGKTAPYAKGTWGTGFDWGSGQDGWNVAKGYTGKGWNTPWDVIPPSIA